MLTIGITNDQNGTNESANYHYRVHVNFREIARGKVEGHNRADEWWKLLALIVEDMKPQEAICQDCGKPYEEFPLDVVLPNDQWKLITGRTDGSGLLCAACIVKRGSELPGVTVAKLVFE